MHPERCLPAGMSCEPGMVPGLEMEMEMEKSRSVGGDILTGLSVATILMVFVLIPASFVWENVFWWQGAILGAECITLVLLMHKNNPEGLTRLLLAAIVVTMIASWMAWIGVDTQLELGEGEFAQRVGPGLVRLFELLTNHFGWVLISLIGIMIPIAAFERFSQRAA